MSTEVEQSPIIEEDEIDLVELFAILLQYRKGIILTTVISVVLVVGLLVVFMVMPPELSLLPNVYTSRGVLLLNDAQQGGVAAALGGQLSGLASLAGVNVRSGGYGPLLADIAKSNPIVDVLAEEFGILSNLRERGSEFPRTASREFIRDRLSVQFNPDLNTVSVEFSHFNPELAKQVPNRVVELLDARFATIGINRNITETQLLQSKLTEVSREMATLESEIRDFQTRYGVLTVEQLATEQITALATARSQLILKEMEISTYSEFARIDDPILRRLQAERRGLEELISQLEIGGGTRFSTRRASQLDLPDLALEFARLERDLRVQAEIFKILTQQYELAKLRVEGDGPIFQVLELAELPEMKSGPGRTLIVIAAGAGSFFLAVIFAFVIHGLKKVAQDPERKRLIEKGMRGEL